MRIYSISKVIAIPIAAILVVILFLAFSDKNSSIANFIIIPVILLAAIYVTHPQLDYWYLQKNPLQLHSSIISWLQKYSPFYNQLSVEDKQKFEIRLCLYIEAREFTSIGVERHSVPDDIKAIISHVPIQMSFHQKDYLIGDYDRVIIYKHPFPSPRMKFLHTAEVETEDKVLIFSLEHFIPSMLDRTNMYNIGFHAFAEAYVHVHKKKDWPELMNVSWNGLLEVSGFTQEHVTQILGYEPKDLLYVLINYYFNFPSNLERVYPDLKKKFDLIFT